MDMETGSEDAAAAPAIRFRAGKKRKAYRQRGDNDNDGDINAKSNNDDANNGAEAQARKESASNGPKPASNVDDGEESAVSAALKMRNAARRGGRLQGVGFSSDSRVDEADQQLALVPAGEGEKAALKGIPDRFMHQTGLLTQLNDRHMTEYIESRLSSRTARQDTTDNKPGNPASASSSSAQHAGSLISDQPTKHGKLLEVDVPLSARDEARRRANEAKRHRTDTPDRPAKRGRNRRNSDDIKRDQLVEAFLHENKLDVYDVPQGSTSSSAGVAQTLNSSNSANAPGDGLSADDRMAEEFRQRYLDEVAMRRQKKRTVNQQPTRQQQQQAGEVLKGPKLGGSRNQRAAVRDALLKQEKERSGRRY